MNGLWHYYWLSGTAIDVFMATMGSPTLSQYPLELRVIGMIFGGNRFMFRSSQHATTPDFSLHSIPTL